ncbi:hypothetical protein [Halomonas sp. BC04]|uniref:hypothetical protein n=1 Tax=Halomonas sp. BC04 TaxID=1403540 RepID=UPI0012DE4411|nr:hypothetical protein [Halomonas sp. BC04]
MVFMDIKKEITVKKYFAVFAIIALAFFPVNIYLSNSWLAVFLAALLFLPMLGAKPKMKKNYVNAAFFGYYFSAIVAVVSALFFYYP